MKYVKLMLVLLFLLLFSGNVLAYDYGMLLIGQDDDHTFLGVCTSDKFYAKSFLNPYGTYGSKYSQTSIWNEYCDFGSKFSAYSAFNPYATKPPMVIYNGKVLGYLTTKETLPNAIDPYALVAYLEKNGY